MTDGIGGQVVFSEVLVTPLGQSKGCGYVDISFEESRLIFSIVEFASDEDAKRAKVDLADKQLLGRPVFIREVQQFQQSVDSH